MTKVVAIVQARLGSSRLPGKVLADLGGQPMLAHVVARLSRCARVDQIVIATTDRVSDDPLVGAAARLGYALHRGPEDDVLARYLTAARAFHADVIVRVTADCPLLDPDVVDAVIDGLMAAPCDYASNTHVRTFPRGLDVEALWRDTLERLGRLATTPATREHVTSFVLAEPALFAVRQVRCADDASDLRLTVDAPEDLALVRRLCAELAIDPEARSCPDWRAVVEHLRANPALARSNAHVEQRAWTSAARTDVYGN